MPFLLNPFPFDIQQGQAQGVLMAIVRMVSSFSLPLLSESFGAWIPVLLAHALPVTDYGRSMAKGFVKKHFKCSPSEGLFAARGH